MPRATALLPILLPLCLVACQRAAPTAAPDAMPAAPSTARAVTPAPAASLPAPASTAPPAPGEATLARYDGYGDLRFGMSAAEATRAWGGELKPVPSATEPCYYLSPTRARVPSEFALMIEGDRFVRYDVGNAREAAPGGGRVGMTAADIEARYPGVEHRPHKYVEGGQVLRVAHGPGGIGVLVFEVDASGKVTAWRAGVPPQVDYIEGCS